MRQVGKMADDAGLTFDKTFIERCLSKALGLDASTGDISVTTTKKGITVVPHFPSVVIVDMSFYEKVYEVLSQICYPFYTVLKPSGVTTKKIGSKKKQSDGSYAMVYEPATARGLYFPWVEGTASRLVLTESCYRALYATFGTPGTKLKRAVPLMEPGVSLDFDKITHVAIAGQSGSGKSYFLKYLLPYLASMGHLSLVDPKSDDLFLWYKQASKDGLIDETEDSLIWPDFDSDTDSDFLQEVTEEAARVLKKVEKRQKYYSDDAQNPNHVRAFKPYFFVIDELFALTSTAKKADREKFFNILQKIALLGRSAKVHLVLVSQRFSADACPTSIRDQFMAKFQLGPITKANAAFLFPDFDPSGITIPPGQGTGLCQLENSEITYPQPFMSPTIKD